MKTCTKFYSINRILIKFKQMHPDEANVVQNADNRTDQVKRYDEVLSLFEMAYPNNLSLNVLKQRTNMSEDMLRTIIAKLIKEKLIKEISEGYYIRYTEEDEKSQDYQTINDNLGGKKPVVAIITSKYCEKLAIEAIMEDKLSFAQFKKEGESNAYTVGRIGSICVVTTKLPMVGKIRKAQIASANTTTRLLGTFDSVTYVILVGVCGGVPHYADYYNHIRRSDVVVSCSNVYIKENGIYDSKCNSSSSQTDIYILCEQYRVNEDEDKEEFNLDKNCTVKSWKLPSNDLVDLANNLITSDAFSTNWKSEIMVVLKNLASTQTNQNFAPPIGSDLLQIEMDGSFVEVEHPQKPSKKDLSVHDPRVHLGVIGSARQLMNDKSNLDKFIEKYNCRALDYEFDQVIESIFGNRKEHFIIIRGISDYEYKIGISGKWEPNASVNAAAFTKMLIEKLSVKNIL
ncbi:hypothetical protein A3Q56_02195 [Intoshia linei]|uniref:Nucleoside phosphorylase domain-containing protein n=1 Tax=Intoshia linei TaxID=1819745 RepID=A0A177B6Z2_9BILA|nr:hypothetical protein A3Q56_02195 [Intoshia linei]